MSIEHSNKVDNKVEIKIPSPLIFPAKNPISRKIEGDSACRVSTVASLSVFLFVAAN